MNGVNITVIGAGSAVFSMRLVNDICKTPELAGSTITLMDRDEGRLRTVLTLASKQASELDFPVTFRKTTDLIEAVEGADFVINTALVGGHTFLEEVRKIGEKHGYFRGIDAQEFNMVSDYYTLTNWNQFGFMLKVARTIEKHAPNAWYLLASNPVFEGTTLLTRHSRAKVVGFCHGYHEIEEIFKALELNPAKVDWQVAGVNHGIWVNRFLYEGEDANPRMKKYFAEQTGWKPANPFDVALSPAAKAMFEFFGRMPVGDSIRNGGGWAWHYDNATKKKWFGEPWGGADSTIGWPCYEKMLGLFVETLRQLAERVEASPGESLKDILTQYMTELPPDIAPDLKNTFDAKSLSGEQHIPFINAIVNNVETRLVANLPNGTLIPGVAADVAVEVPVTVNKDGMHPEKIDPALPARVIQWFLLPRILRMEWALEAFLQRDPSLTVEILLRDPRTKSVEQAEAAVKEVFEKAREFD